MKINKFNGFFGFRESKKNETQPLKNITQQCAYDILEFLKSNSIYTWNQFLYGTRYEHFIVSQIIDKYCDSLEEVKEVKYLMKLEMGEKEDLLELLKDCEHLEEYEKCSEVKKRLDSIKKNQ